MTSLRSLGSWKVDAFALVDEALRTSGLSTVAWICETCRSQQMQVRAWRPMTDGLSHVNHYSQRTFFLRHNLHAFGVRLEEMSVMAFGTRGERGEAIRRSLTYLRTQSSDSGELSRFSVAATMALPGRGSTNRRRNAKAR